MSVCLLDVNVLVALFDPVHPNHEDAHRWFAANRKRGWATCPLTINGCVRIICNPAYPSAETTAADIVSYLRTLCSSPEHEFWQDSISLLDESLFRPRLIGHRSITDIYLLGLAVRRDGALVTFDRSIPLKAVIGSSGRHLEVIGSPKAQ
jgi:hypothetical protein